MTNSHATHRLLRQLPPTYWADLLAGTELPMPCLDERGRDLLFTTLTNALVLQPVHLDSTPKAGRSAEATKAEALFVELANRPDAKPFETMAAPKEFLDKNKKFKTKGVTSVELALRLSLTDLVKAILVGPHATPEALDGFRQQTGVWHPQGLLAQAVERDLVDLVEPLAKAGWNVNTLNDDGLSLAAQARSPAMIEALLSAGLEVAHLEHPELLNQIKKNVRKSDVTAVLATIQDRAPNAPSTQGEQLWFWLLSGKADTEPTNYGSYPESEEKATLAMRRRSEQFDELLKSFEISPASLRSNSSHGLIKGQLSIPAMLARQRKDQWNNMQFAFLKGHEEEIFGGLPHYLEPGLSDYGLWALLVPRPEVMEGRYVESEGTPISNQWVRDAVQTLKNIYALHTPQQWLAWKTEAAATLCKTPSAGSISSIHPWIQELSSRADAGPAIAPLLLNEIEQALDKGVLFMGAGIHTILAEIFQPLHEEDRNTLAITPALKGQRDRLLLACLGNEARFMTRLRGWGASPCDAMSAQDSSANPADLFSDEALPYIPANPKLTAQIERGASYAVTLNLPNAPKIRASALNLSLPAAAPVTVVKPRF